MANVIIVFYPCIILAYTTKPKSSYISNNLINYRTTRLVCDMRRFRGKKLILKTIKIKVKFIAF